MTRFVPTLVNALSGYDVVEVATGKAHALFVTACGKVFFFTNATTCWSLNSDFEINHNKEVHAERFLPDDPLFGLVLSGIFLANLDYFVRYF